MSVNSTVASMRSGSRSWRVPVRNSSISPDHGLGVADREHVVDALELHVARAGDLRRDVARVLDLEEAVVGRGASRASARGSRAARRARRSSPISSKIRRIVPGLAASRSSRPGPLHEGRVGHAGSAPRCRRSGPRPSARASCSMCCVAHLGGPGPFVVGRPGGASEGGVEDQRARCAPGSVAANSAAIGPPSSVPQIAARFGAGRVHHGEHVVHLVLERRRAEERIGQARAATVERDHARELRQPLPSRARATAPPRGTRPARSTAGSRPGRWARRPRRRRRYGGRRSSRSAPREPRRVTLQSASPCPSEKPATSSWSASRPRA